MSKDDIHQLQVQVEAELARKVRAQTDFSKLTEIVVTEIRENRRDAAIHLSYRVSFDTDSKDLGRVAHRSEGVVLLELQSDGQWRLKDTRLTKQALVFLNPPATPFSR